MKTTLNIDDRLLERAKSLAAREGTTLTAIVEEALRARLAPRPKSTGDYRLALPTVKGTVLPRIDVADRDALFDALDNER